MALAAMLIASRHRQVPRTAPRILLTSKESIASTLAGSVMEGAGSRDLRRRTNSRFASALATRITAQHTVILTLSVRAHCSLNAVRRPGPAEADRWPTFSF